jgi:hypothetical protein
VGLPDRDARTGRHGGGRDRSKEPCMTRLPGCFDSLLSLPMPVMVLLLLAYWGFFAFLVHRFLVPWIAGREGQRLGKLEAEVPAQIGLAVGLLISFIAIPVWEQHSLAEESARTSSIVLSKLSTRIIP